MFQRGLYVGHDPSSIAGFTSDLSTVQQSRQRRNSRSKPSSHHSNADSSDQGNSRFRWGNVQEYQGANNEIVLSGNSMSALSLQD